MSLEERLEARAGKVAVRVTELDNQVADVQAAADKKIAEIRRNYPAKLEYTDPEMEWARNIMHPDHRVWCMPREADLPRPSTYTFPDIMKDLWGHSHSGYVMQHCTVPDELSVEGAQNALKVLLGAYATKFDPWQEVLIWVARIISLGLEKRKILSGLELWWVRLLIQHSM